MSIKCLVKKQIFEFLHVVQARAEGPKAPSPGRALKKVPNFKLYSLFLNFNSCPRSISSVKMEYFFGQEYSPK